jgi:hypothetical protein
MISRLFPNTGHKIVDNIVLRNLLPERFDGQEVTVRDATDDPLLGSGSAAYKWMDSQTRWVLTWSDVYPTLNFAHEDLDIVGGKATATNVPTDGVVWSSYVIDVTDNSIIQDVKPAVNLANLDILTTDFDGLKLRVSYAFGSTSAQINTVTDTLSAKLDNININDVKLLQNTLDTFVDKNHIITTFNTLSITNVQTANYINELLEA